MCKGNKFLYQLGRIFFALPFIIFCVLKMVNWQASMESLSQALSMWKNEVGGSFLGSFVGMLQQAELFLMILASLLEGVGGVLLLFGIRTRLAAWLLILFLVPVNILMHPFWFADAASLFPMLSDFSKNLALIGGALLFTGGCCCHICHCQQDSHHMDDRV